MSAVPQEPQHEEVEVDFTPGQTVDSGLSEADYDQKPPEQKSAPEPEENVLDKIVPSSEPRIWVVGPEDMQRTFIQKELSFIGKAQWFSLIGEVLDKALSGPSAISVNSLMTAPGRPGQLRAQDFRDADTFIQAIGKLLSVAPNFLVDSFMIWLNVPDYDRPDVRDLMKLPPDEGGLSDEQGMGIIETFLDQNYNALAAFFGERLTALQQRVQKLNQQRNGSQR